MTGLPGPLGLDRTTCLTLVRSHGGIVLRFGCPFSISGPFLSQFCIGSSARSQLPFVHDFPYPNDASGIARRRHTDFFFQYVESPSVWSSGFYPPRCYQHFIGPESLVLPVNLPPSVPPRFGVSSSSRFAVVSGNLNNRTGGLPWVRRTTSPYPVRLHVSLVLRISGLALSRLLDLLTNTI